MSDTLKNSLMGHLQNLQCHFTWDLLGEDVDISNVEERLNDQIVFLADAYKHRIYNLLAYLKHLKGDHDEAMLQLQKAETQLEESSITEDQDVRRVVMYGNFAWVSYHQNQFIKGFTYAKKAETILKKYKSPPMQKTLWIDIYGEQGWSYLSFIGKYYQRAADCFEKALKLEPEDPELNSGYAMAVYRMEGISLRSNPTNKSIPLLERAVKLNPGDTVLKALLALKYLDTKDHKQGTMLIEQALQKQPESPYVLRYVATFYKRKGQMKKAIAIFKKAADLTPASSAIHYQIAKCYKKLLRMPKSLDGPSICYYLQQNAEAISNALYHSKKAVELNTLSAGAHTLLATIYVKAIEYQKAEEEFNTALTTINIHLEQKQEVHLNWAQYLLYHRRSEDEAIRHFKEAINIQIETWFRGNAIRELKRLTEIMIARNSMDATGYALHGFIHQQTGQNMKALNCYEKACLLEPDNEEYLEACSTLKTLML